MANTVNTKRWLVGLFLVLCSGFIFLTFMVALFPPSAIDLKISQVIQSAQRPGLDQVMKFISWFGAFPVPLFICLLVSLLFYLARLRREAGFLLLTLISGLISTVIKMLVNRPRPTANLVRIVEVAKQQSFPSGHMLFYTIFFGFLLILMWNLKHINLAVRVITAVISVLLILLVPVSRIYLGAHWFTDVLGGFMLGVIYLYGLSFLYLRDSRPQL